MTQKLLIIGMGFLGSSIHSVAKGFSIEATGTNYSKGLQMDVTDIDSINKIISTVNPDFIINCAAITELDKIEQNPSESYQVNAIGAKNVAILAKQNKVRMIHISTDGIFDGKKGMYDEEDIPNPINEYAKSKRLGEEHILNVSNEFVIVRTNFYGLNHEGKFLFNWILNNLEKNKPFTAFDDVIFNPLEVKNLSEMLLELLHTNYSGILHLSSDEVMSKYQFAIRIAKNLGLDSTNIKKGSINDIFFTAKRPLNTSLSNYRAKNLLKTKILTLDEYLQKKFVI